MRSFASLRMTRGAGSAAPSPNRRLRAAVAAREAGRAGADRALAAAGLLAGRDDAAMDQADPDARRSRRVCMVDFAVGGIYDDAYLGDAHHPPAGLDEPRLWRLRAGRPVRPRRSACDGGPPADGAHAARSLPAGDAADPRHRLAAAVDDPVRPGRQVGLRAGLLSAPSIPSCSTPYSACASVDPKLFEAASMLGCRGNAQFYKVVLPAAVPSIFTGWTSASSSPGFAIVVPRDDRRAAGPRRSDHGRPHPVAAPTW